MSKFKQIVKNIALESKKCNYKPEIGTNWDCLPMEMRNECVKWMDFKTRTRLGATSRTEKSLVEAKKHNIDQVRLDLDFFTEWTFEPNSETFTRFQPNVTDAFVSAIFKNCEIKNFWIKGAKHERWKNQHFAQITLEEFAPFRFKRLSVFRNEDFYFFLKNSENLEKVDFYNDYSSCYWLGFPSVIKVKEFRFLIPGDKHFMEFSNGLVQKWIENDVGIGKSVQFVVETKVTTLNVFASKFADRIIEKTDENVRIRMNNEKSQILLRKVGSRPLWSYTFEKWTLKPYSETVERFEPGVTDAFVSAIFKNCEIENFWIEGKKYSGGWEYEHIAQMKLAQFAPFRFRRLSLFRNEDLFFFMKNCKNLEKVDFCNGIFACFYWKLLELPSVLKVKEFRLLDTGNGQFMEFLIGLVQKWIKNDAEVGKSIQLRDKITGNLIIGLHTPNSVLFAEKFADRIIEKTEKEVRIRMNNPTKQILFRIIGLEVFVRGSIEHLFHYSCKVIPIDMPKSEYAVGDGWIQAVYEKGLKRDGKLENPVEFDAEDQAVWDDKYL